MGTTKRGHNKGISQAIALAAVSGLILSLGWGFAQAGRSEEAYTPFNLTKRSSEAIPADNVIRLHVKANSDAVADQEAKIKVRDALMQSFGGALAGVAGVLEAEDYLRESLPEIERTAVACLKRNGYSYGAKAAVKVEYFPDRTYPLLGGEEAFLPEGSYKALTVVLGKGQGENWWCVMYPPLCYFDLVQRTVIAGPNPALPAARAANVTVIDEAAARDVPIEVRSLLLDAIRAGIAKIAKIAGFFARNVSAQVEATENLR